MPERKDGYFYLERLTPQGREVYAVAQSIWSQNQAFQRFEEENDKPPTMPTGENLIELYDGDNLIASHKF
ncbi:MAG TPA: hypothetical protein V6D14_04875 [Coleofasciculaceae cyanobacterium]|jgi:hypothetical protein